MNKIDTVHQSKAQEVFMEWVIDVLIYTVILNLFVHYVSDFYITNFIYSLGVAVVLKGLLVLVMRFEHRVSNWFDTKKTTFFKILKPLTIWGIIFGSKFLILEVLDFIFGHNVDLHNLIALILMIIIMIASRQILYYVYRKLA